MGAWVDRAADKARSWQGAFNPGQGMVQKQIETEIQDKLDKPGKDLAEAKKLQAPDMADALLRQARRTEALRLTQGRGRRSTFLTGG